MTCPHHGPDACCTQCTLTTDGLGFPHPSQAKGRRALQQCRRCGKWFASYQWVHDIAAGRFGCIGCVAPWVD